MLQTIANRLAKNLEIIVKNFQFRTTGLVRQLCNTINNQVLTCTYQKSDEYGLACTFPESE